MMTLGEKALKILLAESDKEMYTAISELTDNQKDIMVVSCIKAMKKEQVGFEDIRFTEIE